MATVDVIEQDRIDAENFLEQMLRDKIPDGEFGKGGALRDLAVSAFANIFAYLRLDNDNTRRRQSLLLLGKDSGTDVDDMVDEILSNFFITRKDGRQSRGVITIFFSQLPAAGESLVVPTTALFYKTASQPFKPDATTDLSYSSEDMTPIYDTNGVVIEYALRVPVVSVLKSANNNIAAGPFINWQFNNPYVTRVENTTAFSGGGDKETTTEMLERAPTAISVRDLNSARSIDAVLREEFSEIDDVFVTGYGDPEMIRDLVSEEATHLRFHAGGFTDVYLRNQLVEEEEFTATVGDTFTDPRPFYCVLRDHTIADFTVAGGDLLAPIVRGDVIHIYNNLPSEPTWYVVNDVGSYGVLVSSRNPFPRALPEVEATGDDGAVGPATGGTDRFETALHLFVTDDIGKWLRINSATAGNNGTFEIIGVATVPDNYAIVRKTDGSAPVFVNETAMTWELQEDIVKYSIGGLSPDFDDKLPARFSGRFTKEVQHSGFVLLPSKPIYRISSVYIEDPTDVDLADIDGRVNFINRMNGSTVSKPLNPTPSPTLDPTLLQYRVWGRNPAESQSGWQFMELQVGWNAPLGQEDMARFDNKVLHVKYDTIAGYDSIWAYMTGTDRRLTCASVIPKGLHPVYLSMKITYELAATATESLDEAAAAAALADFIINYDTRLVLDVSDIVAFLRTTYDVIGYIAPLTLDYDLFAPDGRVIHYQTTDKVLVEPSKYHPDFLADVESHMDDPLLYGVSNRVLRFLSVADLITFEAI